MKLTISLSKDQIQKLQEAITHQLEFISGSSHKEFAEWKLEFFPSGNIRIWAGGYGVDTMETKP